MKCGTEEAICGEVDLMDPGFVVAFYRGDVITLQTRSRRRTRTKDTQDTNCTSGRWRKQTV